MAKRKTNPYEDGDDAHFIAVRPKRSKRKRISGTTKLVVGPKNPPATKRAPKRSILK